MNQFVLSDICDSKTIEGQAAHVHSPIATLIHRLINSQTASDALKASEDIFKVGLQLNTLIFLQALAAEKIPVPKVFATLISQKWLSGNHDLTEGERIESIKSMLHAKTKTQLDKTIFGKLLTNAFSEPWADLDELSNFKRASSHTQLGDPEWCKDQLRQIWSSLENFIDRLARLGEANILVISGGAGYKLSGLYPFRQSANSLPDGVYIIQDDITLPLAPLVTHDSSSSNPQIRVFCRAADRQRTISEYRSLGTNPDISRDDNVAITFLETIAGRRDESERLFGMDKQQTTLKSAISNWLANNATGRGPVLVIGEEGTGKTTLLNRVLNDFDSDVSVVSISGEETHGKLHILFLSIFSALFNIQRGYDSRVSERLRDEGNRLGTNTASRICHWLRSAESNNSEYSGLRLDTGELLKDPERHQNEIVDYAPPSEVVSLYDDLVTFIDLYATAENIRVALWLQDAQLLESQKTICIEALLDLVGRRKKSPSLLVVGEFRAERTRDLERLRNIYSSCNSLIVETSALKEKDIHNLIAERLEISPVDLPAAISSKVYKETGGNPKGTRDLLRLIAGRGTSQKSETDYSTQILLNLPTILSEVQATELKDVSRARISSLKLGKAEQDALTIACFCRNHEFPATLFSEILGEAALEAIDNLEQSGVFESSDHLDEWRLRFEHLAAKQAASELVAIRERAELIDLSRRVSSAWEHAVNSVERRFARELQHVSTRLAELTEDPELLAPTIALEIGEGSQTSIDTLRRWANVLRRTLGNESLRVKIVRKFVILKIREIEQGDDFDQSSFASLALMHADAIDEFTVRFGRMAIMPIISQAFGFALGAEGSKAVELPDEYVNLLNNLTNTEKFPDSKKGIDYATAVLVLTMQCIPKCRNPDQYTIKNLAKSLIHRCQNPLVTINGLRFGLLLLKGASEESFHSQIDHTVLERIIQLCGDFLSIDSSETSQDKNIDRSAILHDAICQFWRMHYYLSPLDDAGDSADTFHRALEISGCRRSVEACNIFSLHFRDELNLCTDKNSVIGALDRYKLYVGSSHPLQLARLYGIAIYISNVRGLPHEDLHASFSEAIVKLDDLGAEDLDALVDIASGVPLLSGDVGSEHYRKCVIDWFGSTKHEQRDWRKVLRGLRDISTKLGIKASDFYDDLRKSRTLSSSEDALFSLFRIWAIQNDPLVKRFDFSSDNFDHAKKSFLKAHAVSGDILSVKAMNISFSIMMKEVFMLDRESASRHRDRLNSFKEILEYGKGDDSHISFSNNLAYWKTRWKILSISGKADIALRECKGFVDDKGAIRSLPELMSELVTLLLGEQDSIQSVSNQDDQDLSARIEEAIQAVKRWEEVEPSSHEVAQTLIRLSKRTPRELGTSLLNQAEQIAQRIAEGTNLGHAIEIYDSLVHAFYEVGMAEKAEQMGARELALLERTVPKPPPAEFLSAKNNHAYTHLAHLKQQESIPPALVSEFEQLYSEAQATEISPLVAYNLAVAYALSKNYPLALEKLEWILKEGKQLRHGRSDETAWLIVVSPTSTTIEFKDSSLRLATLLTGTAVVLKLGQERRAQMWLHEFFGIIKNINNVGDPSLWDLSFSLAYQLKQAIPRWVTKRAIEAKPELSARLEQFSAFGTFPSDKEAPCPCGSGEPQKECCSRLFRN